MSFSATISGAIDTAVHDVEEVEKAFLADFHALVAKYGEHIGYASTETTAGHTL